MHFAVVCCSMNPCSRSSVLAHHAAGELAELGHHAPVHDLSDHDLPFAGPAEAWAHPEVARLRAATAAADGLLIATPIYCYGANAAAKNFIELTGDGLIDKPVGFLCTADGNRSYMAIMSLVNELMLDFRCLVVPRFVYAIKDDFHFAAGEAIQVESDEVRRRVRDLAAALARLAGGLRLADQPRRIAQA